MRGKPYSQEQIDWVRANAAGKSRPEIAEAFNREFGQARTAAAMSSLLKNHGIRTGRKKGNPKGEYKLLTADQVKFIARNYRKVNINDLTTAVNATFGTSYRMTQLRAFVKNHGILSGRTGHFKPGQTWNAGTKGVMKPNRTSFKKGCMSGAAQHNYVPIGSTRVSKDGYLERKVTDDPDLYPARRWVPEHRLIWEAANGPIPPQHRVIFLDGDRSNLALENLVLVSYREHAYLNKTGLSAVPTELKPAAIAAGRLAVRAAVLEESL